jgi:hypothetical protein
METHDKQRRIILRGALTAGCAVAAPMLFTGCNRKESENSSGTGENGTSPASGVATPGGGSAAAQASGKMSKEQAKYQDKPNGDRQCANCGQFVAGNNTCKVVAGEVSPGGWCMLWTKKA